MKIKQIRTELLYAESIMHIQIVLEKGQNKALGRLLESICGINQEKDYDIDIKPKKKKRSQDANAYLWVLIGKLGEKLCLPNTDVYRQYIGEMHTYTIVPIAEDQVDSWIEMWNRGHIGWICEDMGECANLKGYHNLKCYRGSSTFNRTEMTQLVDMVVHDCKEQGIDTITPNELERLKQEWGCD